MILQISSGNGPVECELAVGKFLEVIRDEFPDIRIINEVKTGYTGCFRSVAVQAEQDLSVLVGTVKWIASSPFRPNHKRKNWFIDVSVFEEKPAIEFKEDVVRFQTFHCGGHGGQNVNKVETGVRATHILTGLCVTATRARTQHQNKKAALIQLTDIIAQHNHYDAGLLSQTMWMQHELVERGNPVRTYVGMEFKRKN